MEPKYVPFDEKAWIAAQKQQQMVDPRIGLFNHLPFIYPEWTPEMVMSDPIITEDIPYEIVENKRLPPSKDIKD